MESNYASTSIPFQVDEVYTNFLLYVIDTRAVESCDLHEDKIVIHYYGGVDTTYSFLEAEARLATFIDHMNNG